VDLERSKWAYAVGTIGGALFALGAVLMLLQLTGHRALGTVPLWLLGAGGAALGVGWTGMFRYGHAGFAPIGGSFLVPLAIAYIYKHRADSAALNAHGTMLLLAFAGFTVGHCFVRCLLWARWLAGTAALVFVFQVVVIAAKWRIPMKSLIVPSFAALASLGVALVISIPKLYGQVPREKHVVPHEPHL